MKDGRDKIIYFGDRSIVLYCIVGSGSLETRFLRSSSSTLGRRFEAWLAIRDLDYRNVSRAEPYRDWVEPNRDWVEPYRDWVEPGSRSTRDSTICFTLAR